MVLTDLEDRIPMKEESTPLSSMLFEGVPDMEGEEVKEDPQLIMTQTMDLLMMSPMEQASRTTSPSCQFMTSKLWDPSPESLTGIEPELMHSSQNS